MSSVVLFYSCDSISSLAEHQQALAGQGYEFRHCPDTATLRANLRPALRQASAGGDPVMVVLAAAASYNRSAASILAAEPKVGVLAAIDACDDATLTAMLQLGVDAWCPRTCSPQVLALCLHSLKRRLEIQASVLETPAPYHFPPEDASRNAIAGASEWILKDRSWALQAPTGQVVQLTSSERDFMLVLVRNRDKTATYPQLLRLPAGPSAGHRGARSRLGVLVSRLRGKVAAQGVELPIQSLHNRGYMFTEAISLRHAALDTEPDAAVIGDNGKG